MTEPNKPDPEPDGGAPEKAQEQGSAIKPEPDRSEREPSNEDPDSFDETTVRQDASTINNIYGLYADNAVLGTTIRKPPTIGTIRPEVVAAALRMFCGCEALQRAGSVLSRHHLVILIGPEGSGRYLAALAMLSGWPEPNLTNSIVSYSPTMSIAELARKDTLKHQRRYLLHEMIGDGKASAELRFEIARLKQVLSRTDSHLVITADAAAIFRGDFGELAVSWTPPDGQTIFDYYDNCGELDLSEEDRARAREYAAGLGRPHEVVGFIARLAGGIEAAMHSQFEVDRENVRSWFEKTEGNLDEELMAAAACFLDRIPERVFERCLSRLAQLVREYDSQERAPSTDPLKLIRKPWRPSAASESVVTMVEVADGGEPLVAFRSPAMRRHALAEVWSRYSFGLLEPLRLWIRELVRDVSADVRIQAAMGLALLAERRWADVKESFLDPWSDDIAVNRAAAAATLSMMAASDLLAPKALEVVIAWSDKQGARRAMTAALALAGPLSVRYQIRAFEELWFLTTRGSHIAAVARMALSLQLSGAGSNHERALVVLRLTGEALRWTQRQKGDLEIRSATSATLTVLRAPSLDSDELVIIGLLRACSEAVEVVGSLMSDVLLSAPHYHQAVDLLRSLLTDLTNMDDGRLSASRLGNAVFSPWKPEELEVLRPKIERDLAASTRDVELSRQIVKSFLYGIQDH
jgi:hypothetical protein